jgi:Hint domain
MSVYDLLFISTSDMDTTAASYDTGGGWDFYYGKTITIHPDAVLSTLSVSDSDGTFDDDQPSQTLASDFTVNGTPHAAGTEVDSEYQLVMEDAAHNQYTLLAVSVGKDSTDVLGFVFVGAMPPLGETLTWVSTADNANGINAYASAVLPPAPACFARGTLIETPWGARPVEALAAGEPVVTRDHGAVPLGRLVVQRIDLAGAGRRHAPVEIAAGALGPGLPRRRLRLSPQHRILMALPGRGEVLVPAKALIGRAGVRQGRQDGIAEYCHLVFASHEIVAAEGLPAESLYDGPQARRSLAAAAGRVMAPTSGMLPARPLITVGAARRLFGSAVGAAVVGDERLELPTSSV